MWAGSGCGEVAGKRAETIRADSFNLFFASYLMHDMSVFVAGVKTGNLHVSTRDMAWYLHVFARTNLKSDRLSLTDHRKGGDHCTRSTWGP